MGACTSRLPAAFQPGGAPEQVRRDAPHQQHAVAEPEDTRPAGGRPRGKSALPSGILFTPRAQRDGDPHEAFSHTPQRGYKAPPPPSAVRAKVTTDLPAWAKGAVGHATAAPLDTPTAAASEQA